MEQQGKIKLQSKDGKVFYMNGTNLSSSQDISVTMPGYIITPSGDFIHIGENDYHDQVIKEYLSNFHEDKIPHFVLIEGIKKLNDIGHIVYIGIRLKRDGYCQNSFSASIFHQGFENLTDEQHQAIDMIIANNITPRGNEMFDLKFGNCNELPCDDMIPLYEAKDLLAKYRGHKR